MEGGTPSILVNIEGVTRSLIVDTGSSVSILQPRVSSSEVKVTSLKPYGVTGKALDIKGRQSVSFELGGREYNHTFLVCALPTEAAGLLGRDFLEEACIVIDFECGKMSFTDISKAPRVHSDTTDEHAVLTVFVQGKEGHSPQPKEKAARQTDEQLQASPRRETTEPQNKIWFVKARENITLPPRCSQIVAGKLEIEKEQSPPSLVCVERAQIPVEGIFPARALTRVATSARPTFQVTSQRSQAVSSFTNGAYVMLANFTNEELTVPKATILGVAEELSESIVDKINKQTECKADSPTKPPRIKRNEALYNKLLQGKLDHLTREDRQHIEPILRKYAHVFHDEDTNDFKATHVTEHQIHVGDAKPIRKPPYRTPSALRQEMQDQIQKMLAKGVIRESNSPWAAPALLVPKRSLDGKPKFRFCVDFRGLNSVTKFDPYPLPNFTDATATLHGSKYFSVLDCYSGFWQVNIKEEHEELTGFSVPSGHYEFNRLPFGLSNSPTNFQRLMDTVLRNLVGIECSIFVDDILIYSNSAEEHARRLENVFRRFEEANLQLHPGKCTFAQSQVQYLGYILSENGISPSPEKVKAVRNYPTPKNVREVRAFLGLASFYRRLVPDFAHIAKALTILTRNDQKFTWGQEQQEAFETLKDRLCTAPVLSYPNFESPFILATDASGTGIGAILSQVQNGAERVIGYASRQKKTERNRPYQLRNQNFWLWFGPQSTSAHTS